MVMEKCATNAVFISALSIEVTLKMARLTAPVAVEAQAGGGIVRSWMENGFKFRVQIFSEGNN